MKITCPNDPTHDRFTTMAHVTEDWTVDREGNFIMVAPGSETQVTHGPTVGNTFTCQVCSAEAKAEA